MGACSHSSPATFHVRVHVIVGTLGLIMLSQSASAQDISGFWHVYDGGDPRARAESDLGRVSPAFGLDLQIAGSELFGSMVTFMGNGNRREIPIFSGEIAGNAFTFKVSVGDGLGGVIVMDFEGVVMNDSLSVRRSVERGPRAIAEHDGLLTAIRPISAR